MHGPFSPTQQAFPHAAGARTRSRPCAAVRPNRDSPLAGCRRTRRGRGGRAASGQRTPLLWMGDGRLSTQRPCRTRAGREWHRFDGRKLLHPRACAGDGHEFAPGRDGAGGPQMNQGLVRFLHPALDATEADHDRFTDQVTAAIPADGSGSVQQPDLAWPPRHVRQRVQRQTSVEDVRLVLGGVRQRCWRRPAQPTPKSSEPFSA